VAERLTQAAEAIEAAAAQGHFWGIHDVLFEAHRKLENEDLAVMEERLGAASPSSEQIDFSQQSTEGGQSGPARRTKKATTSKGAI
jgi:hypothetical protein